VENKRPIPFIPSISRRGELTISSPRRRKRMTTLGAMIAAMIGEASTKIVETNVVASMRWRMRVLVC
jgi:hypothetical protein